MKIKRYENYVVIRLEKDEEIVTALKEALQRARIEGGFFYGLGVGKDLQLGYFDAVEKNYMRKDFAGEYEFTNLSGNISIADGQIMVHCHVTITDNEFHAFGGHLFEGLVPATLEIIVFPFSKPLTRSQDKTTGLNLLDL